MADFLLINSIEELRNLCSEEPMDIAVALNGGFKSSKTIRWYEEDELFWVFHDIDGSDEHLTVEGFNKSILGEALEKKAMYRYVYDNE